MTYALTTLIDDRGERSVGVGRLIRDNTAFPAAPTQVQHHTVLFLGAQLRAPSRRLALRPSHPFNFVDTNNLRSSEWQSECALDDHNRRGDLESTVTIKSALKGNGVAAVLRMHGGWVSCWWCERE